MNKYTVVLLRPDYMYEDAPYGQDIYVAHVQGDAVDDAIFNARREVYSVDRRDGFKPASMLDYALCVAFEGSHEVARFGWQE